MSKVLFLDESGDHNLIRVDTSHPVFVLGGIIADKDYAEGQMQQQVNAFKQELFGNTDLHLHTADFTRQKNGFERMKDRSFCNLFYTKLNELIDSLDIKIIACVVKKELHFQKYGMDAVDPYHLSLNVLVERFCFEIGDNENSGAIIAENRDATLDRQLELAWLNLKVSGTKFLQAADINKRIISLNLMSKKAKLAGLELADAIVTPIAREMLMRGSRIDLDIIRKKMRKDEFGVVDGRGIVILPKK